MNQITVAVEHDIVSSHVVLGERLLVVAWCAKVLQVLMVQCDVRIVDVVTVDLDDMVDDVTGLVTMFAHTKDRRDISSTTILPRFRMIELLCDLSVLSHYS